MLAIAILLPVLPLYLKDSGLSLGTTSIVLAAVGFGAALGSFPAGSLISGFGERRVLFGSLVALAGSTALLGVTTVVVALVAHSGRSQPSTRRHRLSR
jgi:MFS family permease